MTFEDISFILIIIFLLIVAVRFGRMPKVEREKLMADKEELEENSSVRILELRSITDIIKQSFHQHVVEILLKFSGGDEDKQVSI